MEDRFGPIPDEVAALFDTVRIRRMAVELGFEKLIFKNGQVKFYFVTVRIQNILNLSYSKTCWIIFRNRPGMRDCGRMGNYLCWF
ncbi:MAG: TRCF domain-containing protein [Puia sp.]